jgi:GT2 family glycosyltransferase
MAFADSVLRHPHFWLLNNDCLVAPDSLNLMVAKLLDNKNIGICSCTLLDYFVPDIVQCYGGYHYDRRFARGYAIGAGEKYDGDRDISELIRLMSYPAGASMLVRNSFYQDTGEMSERYFLYFEELDWVVRNRTYKIAIEPKAKVWHKGGASTGSERHNRKASPFSEYYISRNRLIFTKLYYPIFYQVVAGLLLLKSAKYILQGEFYRAKLLLLSVFLPRYRPYNGIGR